MPDDIVETLTAERCRQGLSMRDVADALGGSVASIHDWEHGIKSPSLRSLGAWAGALGYRLTLTRVLPPEVIGDPEAIAEATIRFIDEHPLGGEQP